LPMSVLEKIEDPSSMSDEALRAWYADLARRADKNLVPPHLPPATEPTIELLREAYQEFWWDLHEGQREHTVGQPGWHRALHKAGWTHG